MQLQFEYHQTGLADGANPTAFHAPDNVIQIMYRGIDGRIHAKEADTPMGNFENLELYNEHLISTDTDVEHLKLVYLPRMNVFATWKSGNRHRKGVFILKQEVNKYLRDCQISMRGDTPVMSISLELENPGGIISAENELNSEAVPGSRINVFFAIGDSTRYPMGVFYIDRIRTSTGSGAVNIDGRSASGKLLRDQYFDENGDFTADTMTSIVSEILDYAGIISKSIEYTAEDTQVSFPPNMDLFDGLTEFLKLTDGWVLSESVNGRIGVGPVNSNVHDTPGIYNFNRGRDCFSREITRDDLDTFARVCVHNEDFSIAEYRDINFRDNWNLARHKTLYVRMPEGSTQSQISRHANVLRGRLGQVGVLESFVGPIRPHLQPGDSARINEDGTLRTLGTITEINHSFGRNGFSTGFTVDSGGTLRKPTISDMLNRLDRTVNRITVGG